MASIWAMSIVAVYHQVPLKHLSRQSRDIGPSSAGDARGMIDIIAVIWLKKISALAPKIQIGNGKGLAER